MKVNFSVLALLLSTFISFSQSITGTVLDAQTRMPIESASVYFDNTTIGTSTNNKGEFEIEKGDHINATLVISFLGYEKVLITDYNDKINLEILLKEAPDTLNEVVISSYDGMSKALKLQFFRAQFLGNSKLAQSCTILNEDDLILKYDKDRKQLSASALNPIQVKNEDLQYLITFELEAFELYFSYANLLKEQFRIRSMFYLGTSFYKPIETLKNRRTERKREKVYKGSVLHFMRALTAKQLKKEKFSIFRDGLGVKPDKYISVVTLDSTDLFRIKMKGPLTVLYKGDKQTEIKLSQSNILQDPFFNIEFYVDRFGNYSPISAFYLVGYMGNLRVGDSLPLDYNVEGDK